jgi:hypothetical protein
MQLQRKVEVALARILDERFQAPLRIGPLRQCRVPGKFEEAVDIAGKPRGKIPRPGQPDQRYFLVRESCAQRAKRGHHAKQVAQLEGTKHGHAAHGLFFSSRKEPIASASMGELQKHSIASRGVHTTGSLRVLKEVFTSTGTPVRRWKARTTP